MTIKLKVRKVIHPKSKCVHIMVGCEPHIPFYVICPHDSGIYELKETTKEVTCKICLQNMKLYLDDM